MPLTAQQISLLKKVADAGGTYSLDLPWQEKVMAEELVDLRVATYVKDRGGLFSQHKLQVTDEGFQALMDQS